MNFNPLPGIKSFYENARHILNISYKPKMEHFQRTMKIVLFGTLIVGILGYLISLIVTLIVGH
ncbi:MAG: protein translocase SEC61 complex subunit gamma [Candidatus Micrarchaeota archaeon]|nr:protein translocase SEC61 complex subunit gamma [Candidatus Micrarchaeota archaeon]